MIHEIIIFWPSKLLPSNFNAEDWFAYISGEKIADVKDASNISRARSNLLALGIKALFVCYLQDLNASIQWKSNFDVKLFFFLLE